MSLTAWLTGALLAAAVIPPLLLLYFLKLRRRPQAIPSTLLWRRSVEDLQANAPFQRLRRSLLLFLQLLVLILLALAVAQPRLHAGQQRGGRLVFLIDNSASMNATDGPDGRTRLEEAKRQAAERVETLYGGGLFSSTPGETMVVAFNERAEVLCRFTDSKQQILAAIERIEPTDDGTALDQAMRLARAYTTNVVDAMGEARPVGEPPAVELYSDGRIADLDEQVLRGEQLNYYPMGAADPENIGVTSVAVQRPFDRPTAVQVFASVAGYTTGAVLCDVQLSVDGVARAIEEVRVPAATIDERTGQLVPGRNNVVFTPFEQPRGAVIEVAVLREDHLAADNAARTIVPPPKRLRVLLVAPTNRLIQSVLEGMALEDLVGPIGGARYEQMATAGELERFDVVVLDGYAPQQMPQGRYLAFGAPPPLEGLNPFGTAENQIALEWREDHPAMQFVTLDNLFVARFERIEPAEDVRLLAEGSRSPLIVSISRGPMEVIYCTFDPLDSNWPFQRSFVNFVVNAVDTLGHSGEGLTTKGFEPGEALTARLPADARDIVLTRPDGVRVTLEPLDPAMWSWGPVRRAGVYTLSWSDPAMEGSQQRLFAVNLLDEAEGDIAPAPTITIGRQPVEGRSGESTTYTPLWPWAIGLCLTMLMVEWWVYHRKTFV